MYCKRILILQQTDSRFAQYKKQLCGMVKTTNAFNTTTVTVFVTNADVQTQGEWWLLISFDGATFSKQLPTLNNFQFELSAQSLNNVACLLVKKEKLCYEVARAYVGTNDGCDLLYSQMEKLILGDTTPYEKFVAGTTNFYPEVSVDVEGLKKSADERYKSVEQYSQAFERFYASGGANDYYQSVKEEIGKVFLQFPPYYPLINKYKGSFFVRVDFPSSEKYFVLGVLQSNKKIRYICYGLPAEKVEMQDKDFVLVENTPTSFWMLFQDAQTGQITTLGELV